MNILNLITAIVVLSVIIILIVFAFFNLAVSLAGTPYVPSKRKMIFRALKDVNPEPNSVFMDLGCGDGYIVRHVAKRFKVNGIGVDINPLLVGFAKVLSFLTGTSRRTRFICNDIFRSNFSHADYVFLYLMPSLLEKLGPRLAHECKPGTIIISNTFPIRRLRPYLTKTIPYKKLDVFVYRIP